MALSVEGEGPMRITNRALPVLVGWATLVLTGITVPQAWAVFIPNPAPMTTPPGPPPIITPSPVPVPIPDPDPDPCPGPIPPPCHHNPEPATLLSGLVGSGLLGLYVIRKRRNAT